ncbi:hypothetical protein DTG57_24285, partial [Salmonella enterica subsp. houtenae]|nr:hypothetical protein [Salmonella enterica subsp. houtenae]
MRIAIENSAVFLLTAFSGIYLRSTMIKPGYIAVVISMLLMIIFILYRKTSISPLLCFFVLFFIGYIWGTQPFLQGEYATLIFTSSIIMLVFLPQMIKECTFKINIAFILIILFYCLESYIRIKNPDYDFEPKELSNSILD